MKKAILILLILLSNKSIGQDFLVFEKKINNEENYTFQDIDFFDTEENIKLRGTLISPKSDYSKIVIIAPGSGKDTRNSHYILTEEFLKNGIAVYRYDDRGFGKSEGKYNISINDNNNDLYYAFQNLRLNKTLVQKKIGILGHSLGGYAALNACANELSIDFLILMSTPVEKFGNFKKNKFEVKNQNKIKVSSEYVLNNIKVPLLFIAGSEDSLFNVKSTIKLLNNLNNKNIQTKIMDGMNHYLKIGNDDWQEKRQFNSLYEINSEALKEIINWATNI